MEDKLKKRMKQILDVTIASKPIAESLSEPKVKEMTLLFLGLLEQDVDLMMDARDEIIKLKNIRL